MGTRSLRPSRPLITVDRVLTALVLLVVAGIVAMLAFFDAIFVYVIFLLVTVFIVRSVPVEPGAWLGLRRVRRGLVVVIALVSLDFLTMRPLDFANAGTALLVVLALCDLALGRATRRLATADEYRIDERQEMLRNRAHRIAYAILGLVGLVVIVASVATPDSRRWLADALGGGGVVTVVQLLFFLPAMVIAWIEPDRLRDDDLPMRRSLRARIAYGMVAIALVLPILLSLTLAVGPIRTDAFTRPEPFYGPAGARPTKCTYFYARSQAGFGFGATVPLTAVACWDGVTAYETWGLNSSDCLPTRTEMIIVTPAECRRTTDPDGTLHFTYRANLRSAILPFVSRDVVMRLDLTKNGKVVQFP